MKRILIVGASSFIGANLAVHLRARHHVMGTYASRRPAIDGVPLVKLAIAPPEAPVEAVHHLLRRLRPEVLFYCAGVADDRHCRTDPMRALILNADVPAICAEVLSEWGGRMFYFSTSKVFSGERGDYREEDATSPRSVYGSCKLRGEEFVAQYPHAFVLRMGNVFGWGGAHRPTFLQRLLTRLWAGVETPLICDEFRSFLGIDSLLRCITPLMQIDRAGMTYHLSDGAKASHYAFGRLVAQVFGLPVSLVKPITGREFNQATESLEERGGDLSLVGESFERDIGRSPHSAEHSLRAIKTALDLGR